MTRILFVMEIGLGHTTFQKNLQAAAAQFPDIEPIWAPITFHPPELLGRIPRLRNDIVLRAGVQAYRKVARVYRQGAPDVLFFHTQMPSVFCQTFLRRTPSVISLDATPLQFMNMGAHYGLRNDPNSPQERRRDRWYRQAFSACTRLFTWSQWAADSLTADYDVPPSRIAVFSPGVDLTQWHPADRPARNAGDPLRLLFVGGEFQRKGGDLLLRWMREQAPPDCLLHIVTRDPVPETPRVTVHSDLNSNDPRLVRLYQDSDAFVLPTRADCYSLVGMEAMACGLPVVLSRVGGVSEMVTEEKTGYLTQPGDYGSLCAALNRLAANRDSLSAMGQAAREFAQSRFEGPRALAGELTALRDLAGRAA